MSKIEKLSKGQEKVLNFLHPLDLPMYIKSFKQIFRAAAIESEICNEENGKVALGNFYSFIEVLEEALPQMGK